jgi:hypothetical protein
MDKPYDEIDYKIVKSNWVIVKNFLKTYSF